MNEMIHTYIHTCIQCAHDSIIKREKRLLASDSNEKAKDPNTSFVSQTLDRLMGHCTAPVGNQTEEAPAAMKTVGGDKDLKPT